MTGLWVADAGGTYRAAKKLWVADSAGTFQVAKDFRVADAGGTYRDAWTPGAVASSFTVANGNPAWDTVAIVWSTAGAVKTELMFTGTTTVLVTTTASSGTFSYRGIPSRTYYFVLRMTDATGAVSYSVSKSVTTRAVPYPTGLHLTSLAATTAAFGWTAVPHADSYYLFTPRQNSRRVYYHGPATSATATGLVASSAYDFAVNAFVAGVASPDSPTVHVLTPAPPGPAHRTYLFNPVSAAAWQPAFGSWRAPSEGLFHGNGDFAGSPSGNQVSYLFYGNRPVHAQLAGGRCTRLQTFMLRQPYGGLSSAQANHWELHNHTGRPAGQPTPQFGAEGGSLAWGQSGWFDLPVSWGQALVDGSAAGIAWGDVYGRYMLAPAPYGAIGQLAVTIG